MSDAFYLSIITSWLWAVLVFFSNAHARRAIFDPIRVPVGIALILAWHSFEWAFVVWRDWWNDFYDLFEAEA